MKKYGLNYSRALPDHRVAPDFLFNKELMSGPSAYFRFLKDGFNASGVKYFHIWLCFISTAAFSIVTFVKYFDKDPRDTDIAKRSFPGYKYAILSQRGGYGAYDNVLQKFQKEEGGIKDLPWDI